MSKARFAMGFRPTMGIFGLFNNKVKLDVVW